jgi:hypothetical protein
MALTNRKNDKALLLTGHYLIAVARCFEHEHGFGGREFRDIIWSESNFAPLLCATMSVQLGRSWIQKSHKVRG